MPGIEPLNLGFLLLSNEFNFLIQAESEASEKIVCLSSFPKKLGFRPLIKTQSSLLDLCKLLIVLAVPRVVVAWHFNQLHHDALIS